MRPFLLLLLTLGGCAPAALAVGTTAAVGGAAVKGTVGVAKGTGRVAAAGVGAAVPGG